MLVSDLALEAAAAAALTDDWMVVLACGISVMSKLSIGRIERSREHGSRGSSAAAMTVAQKVMM